MSHNDPGRHNRHFKRGRVRHSIRLKGYDYTQGGAYFVTLVASNRMPLFGTVIDGNIQLNEYGRVAATMWQRIPQHFPHIQLDQWVVMPNHVHGIIIMGDTPRRGDAFPVGHSNNTDSTNNEAALTGKRLAAECVAPTIVSGSLGAIVGNFKSITARRINRMRKTPGAPVWQRNYYERIVRNERELNAMRQYIQNNPANWSEDSENCPD